MGRQETTPKRKKRRNIGDSSAWHGPSSHSERPVESEGGHTGPTPVDGFSHGNQACIVPRLLKDLLLLKLSHPGLRQQMFTEYH